jgi:peptide/nickel transport system ATP-binding protein
LIRKPARAAREEPFAMTEALLDVEGLGIDLAIDGQRHPAVSDVSFTINRGETYGLVGESGCGKSITALSLIGLLNNPLMRGAGRIRFKGREIQALPAESLRQLRGASISMIFQEPMTALNPLKPVGRQIAEMFVLHKGKDWTEAEKLAVAALASVRVPAPERRARDYPHQLSGGMRQRVMIAIALACGPDLLLADEPTTALDVTVQAEILELIRELSAQQGTAVLLISHDLGLIANMCARVGVMYAGRLVEERHAAEIFEAPSHPYTAGLVASLPLLGARAARGRTRLREIAGVVPPVTNFPAGCRFAPRCHAATAICQTEDPPETGLAAGGRVRCHHHG